MHIWSGWLFRVLSRLNLQPEYSRLMFNFLTLSVILPPKKILPKSSRIDIGPKMSGKNSKENCKTSILPNRVKLAQLSLGVKQTKNVH